MALTAWPCNAAPRWLLPTYVSATEQLDLSGPLGRLVAVALATVAELESANTSGRVAGSHKYLREHGRFAGGKPPYGYRAVLDGDGWKLALDPETSVIVAEMVQRVLSGEPVNSISADFNRRGLASPRNAARDNPDGQPWRPDSLRRILRNPALMGHAVHGRETVYGADGLAVQRGPALVAPDIFAQVQEIFKSRASTRTRHNATAMLLNIAYCTCGRPLYLREQVSAGKTGARRRIYRCRAAMRPTEFQPGCNAQSIRADRLDRMACKLFLDLVDDAEVMERIYVPGDDPAGEIEQVRAALTATRREHDLGQYGYPGGQQEYEDRVARLSERLVSLAARSVVRSHWEKRPTGEKYAQLWERSDAQERRRLMMGAGFEFRAKMSGAKAKVFEFAFRLDPDLVRRAQAAAAGEPVELPGHDAEHASYVYNELVRHAAANAPETLESAWTPFDLALQEAIRSDEVELEKQLGFPVRLIVDTTPEP
jgi:site-specific DNA recombinase